MKTIHIDLGLEDLSNVLEMTWNDKDQVWEYIPPKESEHGQEATGKSVPHNAGDSIPGSGKAAGGSPTQHWGSSSFRRRMSRPKERRND